MPAKFGGEDGATYAPTFGNAMPQAQQDRINRAEETKRAIQEAMAAQAGARPGAPQQNISDMLAQARRVADERMRQQRMDQARRDIDARRQREIEDVKRQHELEWQKLNPGSRAPGGFDLGLLGKIITPDLPVSPGQAAMDAALPINILAKNEQAEKDKRALNGPNTSGAAPADMRAAGKQAVEEKAQPEAIKKYKSLQEQWAKQTRQQIDTPTVTDGDPFGALGGTANDQRIAMAFPNVSGQAMPYFLTKDAQGNWTVEDATSVYQSYTDETSNPGHAGELSFMLNAAGYYDSAASNRLKDRWQAYKTPTGQMAYRMVWGKDDADALEAALKDVSGLQSNAAHKGEYVDYRDLIAQKAQEGLGMAQQGLGVDPGAGTGTGTGSGSGGNSASSLAQDNQAVTYTDSAQLTGYLNSVAKSTLGRELSPAETAGFVEQFHASERGYYSAYYAGGDRTQPDAQGQATAYINSLFGVEQKQQAEGGLMTAFMNMVRGGSFGGGTGGSN